MFIYVITKQNRIILSLRRFLIPIYIWIFAQNLSRKFNLDFKVLSSKYNIFEPSRLCLIDEHFEEDDNWETHFAFNTCNHDKGVNLHGLKFPPRLRNNKMGSYCVEWLKRFCETFGFEYIVLGAYSDAEGFWSKLGFEEIPRDILLGDQLLIFPSRQEVG